jgi:hypothetical protein
MANRRNLKKDLNWLTEEVVSDCLIYMDFNQVEDEKPLATIINDIIVKRDELIGKINIPTSKMKRGDVKKMYNEMVKDLFVTTNNCFENLSKLPRK